MIYYVAVDYINGRSDFYNLVEKLHIRGYVDVEYSSGGWSDFELNNVLPHLRFTNEGDALAYTLSYGGIITTAMPFHDCH